MDSAESGFWIRSSVERTDCEVSRFVSTRATSFSELTRRSNARTISFVERRSVSRSLIFSIICSFEIDCERSDEVDSERSVCVSMYDLSEIYVLSETAVDCDCLKGRSEERRVGK